MITLKDKLVYDSVPTLNIECEECWEGVMEYANLTSEDKFVAELEERGWDIVGDAVLCPDCAEEEPE